MPRLEIHPFEPTDMIDSMEGDRILAAPTRGWKDLYSPEELLDVPCPVCASRDSRDVAWEVGIAVARCGGCGLIFTRTPMPDSQAHYARVDIAAAETKYGSILRGESSHPRDRNYEEHLRSIERHQPPGQLLDVGSHCGFFLRKARERGWQVTGVEPSAVTSSLARENFGLPVITSTLAGAGFDAAAFDAVTLVDVFEHIAKPNDLLAHIHRIVRPHGILFIKVPNARYVLSKHRVAGWLTRSSTEALDAREHLVFYTDRTLAETLRRNGFGVIELRVPLPIQTGGPARRALRALGPAVARRIPRGFGTPLSTDVVAIATPLSRAGAG